MRKEGKIGIIIVLFIALISPAFAKPVEGNFSFTRLLLSSNQITNCLSLPLSYGNKVDHIINTPLLLGNRTEITHYVGYPLWFNNVCVDPTNCIMIGDTKCMDFIFRTYVYVVPEAGKIDYLKKDISWWRQSAIISLDVLRGCGLTTFNKSKCEYQNSYYHGYQFAGGAQFYEFNLSAGWNVLYFQLLSGYETASTLYIESGMLFKDDPHIVYMDSVPGDFDGDPDKSERLCNQTYAWMELPSNQDWNRRCCGDEPTMYPAGDLGYVDPVSQQTCIQKTTTPAVFEWTSGSSACSQASGDYEPNAVNVYIAVSNGNDGCCGDDKAYISLTNPLLDYGFVSQKQTYLNKFLCYNNISSLRTPRNNAWYWIFAPDNPFKILQTNISGTDKKVDFISNSDEWFFCNATGTVPASLKGKSIPEYGSFDAPNYIIGDEVACYVALSQITNPHIEFVNDQCTSGPPPGKGCCIPKNLIGDPFMVNRNNLKDCFVAGRCTYGSLTSPTSFCTAYPAYCGGGSAGIGIIIEFFQKELCENQLQGCLGQQIYDPLLACNKDIQAPGTNFSYIKCNPVTETCKNGVFIKTATSPGCCFGIESNDASKNLKCVGKPHNYDDCLLNGRVFNPETQTCINASDVHWSGGTSPTACCSGLVIDKISGYTPKGSNSSFMCFRYEGNSILSECGASTSDMTNDDLITGDPALLRYANRRVSSSGSTIHLFNNFDEIIGTVLTDSFPILSFNSNGEQHVTGGSNYIKNTRHYSYFEFDIAYSHKDFTVSLFDGYNSYYDIDIFRYLVDGDMPNRAHHVIIPLNQIPLNSIYSIIFNTTAAPLKISLDNFYATPEGSDIQYNSKNYYCSGGFGKWVDDFEPNLNIYPWSSSYYSDWSQYGPYSFVCKNSFAYAWTGHQCCGDDTRISASNVRNYGEFYNDTIAGCFNGTRIYSDMSVSYVKGYEENKSTKLFENYIYKDLLYKDKKFIGCQVPVDKYKDLTISFTGDKTGTTPHIQGQKLFNPTDNVMQQCAVNGSYYCADNAWRQKVINGSAYNGDWKQDGLGFKTAPPGIELVNNGGFGDLMRICDPGSLESGTVCKQCNSIGNAYLSTTNLCSQGNYCDIAGQCQPLSINCNPPNDFVRCIPGSDRMQVCGPTNVWGTYNTGNWVAGGSYSLSCGPDYVCGSTVNHFTTSTVCMLNNPYSVTMKAWNGLIKNNGVTICTDSNLVGAVPCTFTFTPGTVLTLEAVAPPGKVFKKWSGACTGTSSTCIYTVNNNQGGVLIEASFAQ